VYIGQDFSCFFFELQLIRDVPECCLSGSVGGNRVEDILLSSLEWLFCGRHVGFAGRMCEGLETRVTSDRVYGPDVVRASAPKTTLRVGSCRVNNTSVDSQTSHSALVSLEYLKARTVSHSNTIKSLGIAPV